MDAHKQPSQLRSRGMRQHCRRLRVRGGGEALKPLGQICTQLKMAASCLLDATYSYPAHNITMARRSAGPTAHASGTDQWHTGLCHASTSAARRGERTACTIGSLECTPGRQQCARRRGGQKSADDAEAGGRDREMHAGCAAGHRDHISARRKRKSARPAASSTNAVDAPRYALRRQRRSLPTGCSPLRTQQ